MDRLSPAALLLLEAIDRKVVTAADVGVCRRTARSLILRRLLSPGPLARILRLREGTAALGFQPRPLCGLIWDAKLYTLSRKGRAALLRARPLAIVDAVAAVVLDDEGAADDAV